MVGNVVNPDTRHDAGKGGLNDGSGWEGAVRGSPWVHGFAATTVAPWGTWRHNPRADLLAQQPSLRSTLFLSENLHTNLQMEKNTFGQRVPPKRFLVFGGSRKMIEYVTKPLIKSGFELKLMINISIKSGKTAQNEKKLVDINPPIRGTYPLQNHVRCEVSYEQWGRGGTGR